MANSHLLNNVLRGEWGFVGIIETDYDGSFDYMISDKSPPQRQRPDARLRFHAHGYLQRSECNANDHTPAGIEEHPLHDQQLRYYKDGDPNGGIDNMTKPFIGIDVVVGVLLIA